MEAGIDISADNLHTELAPLNSIVQRAGRCARYEGVRGIGTVWIYELLTNRKGLPDFGPYQENDQKALISGTVEVLERHRQMAQSLILQRSLKDLIRCIQTLRKGTWNRTGKIITLKNQDSRGYGRTQRSCRQRVGTGRGFCKCDYL